MDPRSRWEQERQDGKNKRMKFIVEAAERVFSIKGFEKTTMQDIADDLNLGIATIFRYFPKKDKLIVAVAINVVERYYNLFTAVAAKNATCYEKMEALFDYFIADIEPENLACTKLLEVFESYASTSLEELEDYQEYTLIRKKIAKTLTEMIEEGSLDGSIRTDIAAKDVLSSIINAFGLFSRKLSLYERIPFFEDELDPHVQLAIIKGIFMEYIKPKQG
ncbi:TetR/AcrR family transcriptional regulator [Bacillus ndiopicus]|uniref:TetR/AcrR family transcriptional regulator n=1 Tax=Bacillus ndiopicus TaxID=1347368 RepID=UPI000693B5CF|nr:TetR/AcrR family transcriptional regulator [Bacillus ndiopicus]